MCFGLFRGGTTTRAGEVRVPKDIIETKRLWNKVERKRGDMPRKSMAELDTKLRQALATKLCFSKSL